MKNKSCILNSLIGIGIFCFVWYLFLMFFSDLKGDSLIGLITVCVGALLFPMCMIYKNGITKVEIKKGTIVAICSLFANLIIIYFAGHKNSNFIDIIINVLSSEPYRWIYLISLVVTGICVTIKNSVGLWLTAILLGILAPAIIIAVFYIVMLVIALIFVLVFGSRDSSSGSFARNKDFSSNTSSGAQNTSKRVSDSRRYARLKIEYATDEDAARNAVGFYKAIEALPLDFTNNQISRFLNKKYRLGYDPVIVKTEIDGYVGKDYVEPLAFMI